MSEAALDPGGDAAQPFSAKGVAWMLLVGVFAFAAFTVLSAYAPDLRSGRDGRGHALSKSAIGFAGLVALARAAGTPVVVNRGPAPPTTGLVILTPEIDTDPAALGTAIDRAGGSVVVVLPKWRVGPAPGHPGWVAEAGLLPADAIVGSLKVPGPPLELRRAAGVVPVSLTDIESARAPLAIGRIRALQSVRSAAWTPALIDQAGDWIVARSKARPNLLVVADPDLLDTQGLKDLGRARQAMLLLDDLRGQSPVQVDVSLNGFSRSRGVLKLGFEPPFLGATLCAAAAALLMGLHAAARFGAPVAAERAFALGKTALADNSAALLRLARREPAMAAPYADLTRQLVARAVGAPRQLDRAALDAVLDRLAVKSGRPPAAAALSAEAARTSDIGGLMAVARKLYDFRRGMTRERD